MNQVTYIKTNVRGIELKRCHDALHAGREHLHPEMSVGYVERGTTDLRINGQEFVLAQGEAIFIDAGVSHRCQPRNLQDWAFTMLYIRPEFYGQLRPEGAVLIKKLEVQECSRMLQLFHVLESREAVLFKEEELANTLMELLEAAGHSVRIEPTEGIERVRTHIEQHFQQDISLEMLADRFGMNKFSLIRAFKALYNTSPGAYQLQLRAALGKQLLQAGESVIGAALESGFYDQAHFSKAFKEAYGNTPSQYRRAVHGR